MNSPLPVRVIDDPVRAAAALDPVRIAILRALREPASATTVAASLGLPRQRVGYHVRELQKHGFLETVGERRRGNCTERLLRVTAESFVVAPSALAVSPNAHTDGDRFSIEALLGGAARTLADAAALRGRSAKTGKRSPTVALSFDVTFRSFPDQAAFAAELEQAVSALMAKYHAPDGEHGRRFRIAAFGYPNDHGSLTPE
jgi:DNA-binding transcriptional ArsR family regulator